jgi:purine-binding chemotaxis protein CheW
MNSDDQILKERARQLAIKRESINNDVEAEKILVVEFLLFPEKYAISANFVDEVLTLKEITPLPGTQQYMMGVINFRGKIVPVINLKILFMLKEQGLTEMNKVLILRKDQVVFGLLADGITGSQSIAVDQLAAPPLNLSTIGKEFINGLMPDGTIVLDAAKMLDSNVLNKKIKQ